MVYETRMASFERERAVAEAAAREAGAIVKRYYEKPIAELAKSDKGAGREENWLTQADSESDDLLKARLLGAFPEYGWLSEETKDSPERLRKERVWIVDPLDGTREFTLRVPEFCVCVALVENGRPVVGVEYNPATDRLYSAALGAGTTMNGAAAHVSKTEHVALAQVLASRSEDKRGEWDPFKEYCHVVLTGSVAYKLAELSVGNGDATFTLTPKNEWDICAGTILVEEAGGQVTGLDGNPLVFNQPSPLRPGMIASNRVLHPGLVTLIEAHGGKIPRPPRR
jgi:myo-inositol-1(or 4)-monophosphatase